MAMTPLHLIRILLWVILWTMALVGVSALAIFVYFYVDHVQNCRPPPSRDGPFRADCFDTETVMYVMLVYGAPFVLPLLLTLGVRALARQHSN